MFDRLKEGKINSQKPGKLWGKQIWARQNVGVKIWTARKLLLIRVAKCPFLLQKSNLLNQILPQERHKNREKFANELYKTETKGYFWEQILKTLSEAALKTSYS